MIRLPIPFRSGDQPVAHNMIESRLAYLKNKREVRDREFKEFLTKVLKVRE